ncbi:armadillo-type protein [Zopfochytrium polystomum]|nr:armadillo-type protein [Zopfochytrium polystomum]
MTLAADADATDAAAADAHDAAAAAAVGDDDAATAAAVAAVTAAAAAATATTTTAGDGEATYFEELRDFAGMLTSLLDKSAEHLAALLRLAAAAAGSDGATTTPASATAASFDRNAIWRNFALLQPMTIVLTKYQEQPNLLDPHLESLVSPIVKLLRDFVAAEPVLRDAPSDIKRLAGEVMLGAFRSFYLFCKVRGYKTVVKFLTHEASDLEPTLSCLQKIIPAMGPFWEIRYVLILWLSLIVMIPFDLATIDSQGGSGIVNSIIDLCKEFLTSTGKEQEGVAVLLTRLLTRRDTVKVHLPAFLNWCYSEALTLCNTAEDQPTVSATFLLRGILCALASILKLGPREMLQSTLSTVFALCRDLSADAPNMAWVQSNSLLRKLVVKLGQRAALCCLKPKVQAWRYSRGRKSLASNLGAKTAEILLSEPSNEGEGEAEELVEDVEEVMGLLLNSLRDRDTVVRWSAAKGVGRISSRLPQELATEIVDSVLALFAEDAVPRTDSRPGLDLSGVSDQTWHGACLATAELTRRGLLLPDKLAAAVPWIQMALQFEQRRGAHSIGANVRDSACYVFWSFARVYDPALLLPHIVDVSISLVLAATLDREINVRRAASAALQECVGRLGGGAGDPIPHGLELITIADYGSVGNRSVAVLEAAVDIARFDVYRAPIVDRVAHGLVVHWDKAVRELGAACLERLTPLALHQLRHDILPFLLSKTSSSDLIERHGSILAVGHICLGWSNFVGNENGQPAWDVAHEDSHFKSIVKIVTNFPVRYMDSFGSEMTRVALCQLVSSLCKARWPVVEESASYLEDWWNLVRASLDRREESVQEAAAAACGDLAQYCFDPAWPVRCAGASAYPQTTAASLTALLMSNADPKTTDKYRRRGASSAVGRLPACVLADWADALFASLIAAFRAREAAPGRGELDADARRNAVSSCVMMIERIGAATSAGAASPPLSAATVDAFVDALFYGMEDYSIDTRGDVGSWVREACFAAWPVLFRHPFARARLLPPVVARAIRALVRHAAERIDRTREAAGRALEAVVVEVVDDEDCAGPEMRGVVPAVKGVIAALAQDGVVAGGEDGDSGGGAARRRPNWLNAASVFPRMVRLLSIAALRRELLLGLVVSVGGISETLVRSSAASFTDYMKSLPTDSAPVSSLSSSSLPLPHPQPHLREVLDGFVDLLSSLGAQRETKERVLTAAVEVCDVLIGSGAVTKAVDEDGWGDGARRLFETVKKEVGRSKDVKKVLAAVKVYGGLSTLESNGSAAAALKTAATQELVTYLAHPYPLVRRSVSELLYLTVTASSAGADDDGGGGGADEVEEVLLTTEWDTAPIAELKRLRARVAELLQ